MNRRGSRNARGRRLAGWSFWTIMAIHIVVFTSIGLFTPRGWTLLLIFLAGTALLALLYLPLLLYARRHPEKSWTASLPFAARLSKKK